MCGAASRVSGTSGAAALRARTGYTHEYTTSTRNTSSTRAPAATSHMTRASCFRACDGGVCVMYVSSVLVVILFV